MRYLTFLVFCFTCATVTGQSFPSFKSYAGKYYYVQSVNDTLSPKTHKQRADSLTILAAKANADGDKELADEFNAEAYRMMLFDHVNIEKPLQTFLEEANEDGLVYVETEVHQLLGDFYSGNNQQQNAAIDQFITAYNSYKNFTGDEFPPKQEYTYMLGGAFYRYGDYENAIKYLQEAWRAKRSVNKNMYCSIFNTIGLSYRNMHKYDSAILYFQRTHDEAAKLHNLPYIGITTGNIGITYYLQGKYDEAIPLLKEDIATSLATTQLKNAAASMAILATIYNYRHNYKEAGEILTKAVNICESKPFWPDHVLAEQLFTQLAKVYAVKNDFHRAYLYADSALMAKDSVASRNNSLTLANAHDKIEFAQHKLVAEKLQDQIKIDKLEIGKKRIEITFFFVGIAALLLVIIFIARERKRSESLLLNILPEKIAERLKRKEHPIADYFDHASILFIDMAGFTLFSDGRDPKEIVNMLNTVFTRFDAIAEKYGLEKIKTIGDCYMAVSGLPNLNPHHAEAAAKMALEVKNDMRGYTAKDGTPIAFRIGLDCGPVVAGVIGRRKFIYDLWGDTVNTASRMESTGLAGEIHCSDRFKNKLEGKHTFESRGVTEIKGKGMMETWLIVS